MKHVSTTMVRLVRQMRRDRVPMSLICRRFREHDRDTILEVIDASYREQDDLEASKRVNRILTYQAAGWPLVNGNPVYPVRPAAMF